MGNDIAGLWIPNRPSPKCRFGKGGVQKAGDKRQKTGGRRQETKIYYYCPLKINPLVDDTGGVEKYKNKSYSFNDKVISSNYVKNL